mmetsp:Transcript_833/g.1305  ORF Transcript_833/g.1305 Transcript_833/m.1305 type:complete len:202 (-) Transcript_833:174-779(-)
MKLLYTIPILFASAEGFSMLTPRFADFPRRFGKYLKEFDEIFEPDWPSTFMEKQLEEFKKGTSSASSSMIFHRASPRYEVTEKADKFEVKVEVPGFKAEEIEVGLKGGGRVLTISAMHEEKEGGQKISSQFQQNFSLDPSIQTDHMTADLKGNTLFVAAPRVDSLPESRKIPIQRIAGSSEEIEKEGMSPGEVKESEAVKP